MNNEATSAGKLIAIIRTKDGRRYRVFENPADHIRIGWGSPKPSVDAPAPQTALSPWPSLDALDAAA